MRLISSTSALLLLACATAAYGADSYNPANKHLTMPSVAIGGTTYSDMVARSSSSGIRSVKVLMNYDVLHGRQDYQWLNIR